MLPFGNKKTAVVANDVLRPKCGHTQTLSNMKPVGIRESFTEKHHSELILFDASTKHLDDLKTSGNDGKVKWFNPDKGFRFVANNKDGNDVFVHFSSCVITSLGCKSLNEGQKVTYDTENEPKDRRKARTVNIRLI